MYFPMPPELPPVALPPGLPTGWTLIGHRISATIEGCSSAVTADTTAGAPWLYPEESRRALGYPARPHLTATEAG